MGGREDQKRIEERTEKEIGNKRKGDRGEQKRRDREELKKSVESKTQSGQNSDGGRDRCCHKMEMQRRFYSDATLK